MGGFSSDDLQMMGMMLAGNMPLFALMVFALVRWLGHWRRGTPGMNLIGAGILGELALFLFGPLLSILASRASMAWTPGAGPQGNPHFVLLMTSLLFSVVYSVPLGLLVWGGFTVARERQDEDRP